MTYKMEVHEESGFPRNLTHKIPYVKGWFSESPFFFHAIWATLRGDLKNIENIMLVYYGHQITIFSILYQMEFCIDSLEIHPLKVIFLFHWEF